MLLMRLTEDAYLVEAYELVESDKLARSSTKDVYDNLLRLRLVKSAVILISGYQKMVLQRNCLLTDFLVATRIATK